MECISFAFFNLSCFELFISQIYVFSVYVLPVNFHCLIKQIDLSYCLKNIHTHTDDLLLILNNMYVYDGGFSLKATWLFVYR